MYWLALSATPELVDQLFSVVMLPVLKTFSPYVVVSVRSKVMGIEVAVQVLVGLVVPVPEGKVAVGVT